MGALLYILLQTLVFLALAYVGYRYVMRKAQENRAASITEQPDETDYVPEPVTRGFINRVSLDRNRAIHDPAALGVAAELVKLNPAGITGITVDSYDGIAMATVELLRTAAPDHDQVVAFETLLQPLLTGQPVANAAGAFTYLRNWWAQQPVALRG